MNPNNSNNRWSAFTDEELNILSAAMFCQGQYSRPGAGRLLEQQIREEIAKRQYLLGINGVSTYQPLK